MIKKPLAAIEGNGGFYGFQRILAWGVAPIVYTGTFGLGVWKGGHLRAKRATEPQEEVFLTSKLISTVGLV